jgi:hypothetical protein
MECDEPLWVVDSFARCAAEISNLIHLLDRWVMWLTEDMNLARRANCIRHQFEQQSNSSFDSAVFNQFMRVRGHFAGSRSVVCFS